MKNYYQILNIKPTATDEEIKRSYRVLAKRYHPDVNPGDSAASEKFSDINEANSVLSDPKARAEYDQKLKEAATPRRNPEDIIARQRAQAQAAARQAARQAAYRNSMANNASTMGARTRQTVRGAQYGTAASAQAQVQAQMQALRQQAYISGREQGLAEAKAAAEAEKDKLTASVRTLTTENRKLKKDAADLVTLRRRLVDAEQDRRELEHELFNRDRELAQEKIHSKEIEDRLQALNNDDGSRRAANNRVTAENATLKEKLEELRQTLKKAEAENATLKEKIEKAKADNAQLEQDKKHLEQERKQIELKSQAQIQLQQDKRKQFQEEAESLKRKVAELTADSDGMRAEIDRWQQYAKSEEFLTDTERRLEEWSKKTQADRRLAKPTLYGALGVLIWATEKEIDDAHAKLVKRYSGKTDEAYVEKLKKIEAAYATLSDPIKRDAYNKTINITPERILDERRLIAENESLTEEYRNRLASKEFWAHFDDLTANALEGDVNAQYTLGEMYYYGDEIEREPEQAVFWFKEAAKQKHPDAMYSLGICFVNGEGVERNIDTGTGFIRQAAKLGSKAAKQYVAGEKRTATAAAAAKKTD